MLCPPLGDLSGNRWWILPCLGIMHLLSEGLLRAWWEVLKGLTFMLTGNRVVLSQSYFSHIVIEWETSPRGPCIQTLGPQLVVLFGEVMKPLGGRALLNEVHRWRKTWWVYSLILLTYLFLGYGKKCDLLSASHPPLWILFFWNSKQK